MKTKRDSGLNRNMILLMLGTFLMILGLPFSFAQYETQIYQTDIGNTTINGTANDTMTTPPTEDAILGENQLQEPPATEIEISQRAAGVTPDSIFYGLDVFFDNLRYAWAGSEYQKAVVGVEIAEERLLETQQMLLKKNFDRAQQAIIEYENALENVKSAAEAFSQNPNVDTQTITTQLQEIKILVDNHEQEVKKINEQAAANIAGDGTITPQQEETANSVIDSLETNAAEVQAEVNVIVGEEISGEVEDAGNETEENQTITQTNETAEGINETGTVTEEQVYEQLNTAARQITLAREIIGAEAGNATNETNETQSQSVIAEAEVHLANALGAFNDGRFADALYEAQTAEELANDILGIEEVPETAPTEEEIPQTVADDRGEIRGFVFEDFNGDGIYGVNEAGMKNWTIMLSGPTEDFTVTDENGRYVFTDLEPGEYVVSQEIREGWMQTFPRDDIGAQNMSNETANTTTPYTVTVDAGSVTENLDFGNFRRGKITGMIYNDANENAVLDEDENGLFDWTVVAEGPAGNLSVITDDDGNYSFENLSVGTYLIRQISQSGWRSTHPADEMYNVAISSGVESRGNDFGNV